ncbi:uncharacterized protein LOC117323311 [Pecten maximus]|uniref:uncharacterized protein LOC117323311 n=1 Tax=Pecten maximus TaxID=6579 RepID=UPI0014586C9A|nr:uncharacterized protein LOC117323311 [Pecten maximus]
MRRRFARKGPKYKRFVYDSSGRRVEYFRYQGSSCNTSTKNEGRCSDVPLVVPDNNQVDDLGNVASGSNRKYSQKRKQLSDSWKAVREKLLAVRTEELSPSTFYCCRCGQQTDEIIRCKDCSHLAYYCQPCCDEIHATVLFHAPSIWKVHSSQFTVTKVIKC